jgi:prolyl oligopeptidase
MGSQKTGSNKRFPLRGLIPRSLFAYALSQSGSDWCKAKIRRVESREDYPETLKWLKFTGLVFTHDNKGLFYSRYPEPVATKDEGTETDSNKNAMV